MTRFLLLAGGLLILALPTAPAAQLQDSCWPMFHHDLQHTGRSPHIGPDQPTLKWSFPLGAASSSSPSLDSNGIVYIGCESGEFFAVNPDGSYGWSYQVSNGSWPYIRGAAALDEDGTVYIGQWDTKKAYAFHADGTLKWISETTGAISFCGPAIGPDGTVYVLGCGLTRGLSAIDPLDGSIDWRVTTGDTDSWNEGSPAMGYDGRFYFGSGDKHIYCVNTDGSVAWTYPTVGSITRGPAIGADGTIYVGSGDSIDFSFYAINPDGTLKWIFTGGHRFWSAPAIGADGTIYVGCDDHHLYAIEDHGTHAMLRWSFPTGGYMSSSPAIGADGTIYIGSHNHRMYAVNPDGTQKWQYATGGIIDSSPAIGADGTLYFSSRDGNLYAIWHETTAVAAEDPTFPLLRVHGNPVQGSLQLQLGGEPGRSYQLVVYDIAGRALLRRAGTLSGHMLEMGIPMHDRPAGVYLVRARVGDAYSSRKVTILR